jgi:hypothetical protein
MKILGLTVLLLALTQFTYAATITDGQFSIGGTIYVTAATDHEVVTPGGTCAIGVECIFWSDPTGNNLDKVDISNANLPNGDIPVALAGNLAANISKLTRPPNVVGPPGFPATNFMTFNTAGVTTQLLINFIDNGLYTPDECFDAPASGQHCTLPNSLFSFVNDPPPNAGELCEDQCQAVANWVFEGITAGNPTPGTWVGNFSATFDLGTPFQKVFADLADKGFVSHTFSGTITLIPQPEQPIPEPGTMGLAGGVLLIVGLVFRKRAGRNQSGLGKG